MSTQIKIMLVIMSVVISCGTEEPTERQLKDYYPIKVGDYWEYKETNVKGEIITLRYEVTKKQTKKFKYGTGEIDVFIVENTFPGKSDEKRIQYIEDNGTRVIRHRHEILEGPATETKTRNWTPGFLRLDRSKLSEGKQWKEDYERYTDTLDGSNVKKETVSYIFKVESLNTEVTLSANGKSYTCLRLKRTDTVSGEVKEYYYAPGIGKVKEVTEGDKTEELSASNLL